MENNLKKIKRILYVNNIIEYESPNRYTYLEKKLINYIFKSNLDISKSNKCIVFNNILGVIFEYDVDNQSLFYNKEIFKKYLNIYKDALEFHKTLDKVFRKSLLIKDNLYISPIQQNLWYSIKY